MHKKRFSYQFSSELPRFSFINTDATNNLQNIQHTVTSIYNGLITTAPRTLQAQEYAIPSTEEMSLNTYKKKANKENNKENKETGKFST